MTALARDVPRTLAAALVAFLGFGSPRLLLAQLVVALVARPWLARPTLADGVIVLGVLLYWPLQEWVLHKYVLHAGPVRLGGRVFETGAARAHRRHHESPLELGATLLPTWTIAVLVPLHVAAWWWAAPPALACTGILCLGAAALAYEWIHFLTHTAHRPRSAWFGEVKRRHMAHHQRDPRRWFGFTVPALDDCLGTGGSTTRK